MSEREREEKEEEMISRGEEGEREGGGGDNIIDWELYIERKRCSYN